MPYNVELPDGTLVTDIPDDMPQDEVRRQILAAYPQFGPKQSTLLGEVKRGAKQLVSSTQTGIGAITSPEEAARAGVERAQRIAEEAGEGVSFAPVKEAYEREGILSALGEAVSQVPRAVAQMAPAAAATIAGGKAGAVAGTAAAPFLGPLAPVAPLIGGALGAGAALYPSIAGANIERQAQEQLERGQQVQIDRPAAYGTAVGQTALEAAGTGAILGKRLVKSVLGITDDAALAAAKNKEALVQAANRTMLAATGRGALRGATEIPVEIAQSVLERAQAGLDVTSPEALAEYGDAAYQAALGGMGLGAVTGIPERAQARAELGKLEVPKEQQEAQRRFLAAREREQAEAAAPKGYEGDQGLLFKPTKVEAEKEKLPTDPAELQAEFTALTQQEQTPETQDRMAKLARQYEAVMAKQPEAAPQVPTEQLGLGLEGTRESADMYLEIERLKQQPKTPEVSARIKELQGQIKQINVAAVSQLRADQAQREREAQMAAESAFAPQPPARPTGYTAEGQGRLFTPTEMRESGLRRGEEKPVMEPKPTTPKQLERAGQRRLLFEKAEKAAPEAATTSTTQIVPAEEPVVAAPAETVPEPKLAPKYPAELQPVMDKLTAAGVRPETQAWAQKTPNRPFLRKLMAMAPEAAPEARRALKLKEGTPKAEVFDALFPTPGVPAFEPAPGAGESRLGLLGQLGITPPAAPAPRAGKPVRRGVVPAGRAAPAPAAPEVRAKPALKEKPLPSGVRAEQFWKDTAKAVGGKSKPFSELTPAQRAAWREAVRLEDVGNLRSEYERIVAEGPGEELPNVPLDRDELVRRAQSAAQRQQNALKRIAKAFKEGTLNETGRSFDAFTAESAAEELRLAREQLAATKRKRDTAEDFVARIAQEAADGNLDPSLVEFTNWAYANNRGLLDGIRLQVLSRPESDAEGTYNGLAKLLRLHKDTGGVEDPKTLAHELTHSAEQMMSDAQQLQLINEWSKLLGSKIEQETKQNKPHKEFWDAVIENLASPTAERQNKVISLLPSYDYYQYVNASEYWAVNGGKILQAAAEGSPLFRFKLFLQRLLEGIKSFLGKDGKPEVYRLAREVLLNPSERTNKNMLRSRYNISIGKEAAREVSEANVPSPTEGIAETSELMKDLPSSAEQSIKKAMRLFLEKDDVPFTTRFRTEIADAYATVVNRLNVLYDGKVRDELTKTTSPELLMRQAQAAEQMFNAYLTVGGIEKDTLAGQYVITKPPKGVPSHQDVLEAIKKWGDAQGMDFKLAYAEASKMLEAQRLNEMLKVNKAEGEDVFTIHKLSQKDDRTAEEQVAAAMRGFEANPEVKEIGKLMDAQRAYMIDKMVDVGRISKDTAQQWKDASGYVPFDRIDKFFDKFSPKRTTGRGLAQLGALPKLVGTNRLEVGNVFDNQAKLMTWMLKQTIKQDATYSTLRTLADIGQARDLKGNKHAATNPNNVVKTYKNGIEQYFEVKSHWDVEAFKDLQGPKSYFAKVFAGVSNILRKIVTVMPPFVAKQVTDDIQRAFVTSGVEEPYKLVLPAITNFLRIAGHELVFGKSHPFTTEFAKKGLVGDVDYNASNPAEVILFNLGYSQRGWLSSLHHRLESVTRASDLAIRKAIYDRTLAETKSAILTGGDMGLATARAREFINFRRRGASQSVGSLIATVPFFNAYLQSTDLLLRSMAGRGSATVERATAKRLFWLQASKMLGFSLIYALTASGDEEYEKLTLDERANNWVIDGKTLPAPGDLAALFKVPVEALVHYMDRLGTPEEQLAKEAIKQTLGYAFEQYVGRVTPVPQAVRPVLEALVNHSFVTGRQLVGTYQKGLPAPLQTVTSTSELAKAIAKFAFDNIKDPVTGTPLELSPIIIDNTLRGYLGGAVPLLNMLVDQMINPNKTDRPLSQYWFLSQYLTPEVPQGPKEEFYDLVNKVMPVKRALDKLSKEDMEAAMKYAKENEDKLKMAELVNIGLTDLRQTREYIKFLDSAEGAKKIESSAERLKIKQQVQEYENKLLDWVRRAKTQIFLNQKG